MTSELLTVRRLSAWYGSAQVLFDVDLAIMRGMIVGLLGRNGAGKTSTLRAIVNAGIRRSGLLVLDGVDVSRNSLETMARQGVLWVPDDRRVFTRLTVRQNLELSVLAAGRRQAVPVEELCALFPMLPGLLTKHGNELSGGEQQLVAVARALVARPDVLLLDEPTEGLAPLVVKEIVSAIGVLPREFGVGILLVEENAEVAASLCREVTVLQLGKVAYHGAADTFFQDTQLRDSLLALPTNNIESDLSTDINDHEGEHMEYPDTKDHKDTSLRRGSG
jgi:branched-chain amino acid transport system ATP-binding protein